MQKVKAYAGGYGGKEHKYAYETLKLVQYDFWYFFKCFPISIFYNPQPLELYYLGPGYNCEVIGCNR